MVILLHQTIDKDMHYRVIFTNLPVIVDARDKTIKVKQVKCCAESVT